MQEDSIEATADDEIELEDTDDDEEDVPPAEDEEASLDELYAKKSEEEAADDDADDASVLTLEPEDRVAGTLPSNVQPLQMSEFTCRNCFLVKSKSQLADRKRMLCRDCA